MERRADCTRLGLLRVVPDARWVLSGINHGANLGADVYYSGTVAAVREAVLHGWPGVALSYYRKVDIPYDWARATRWVVPILADLLGRPVEQGFFYNVNLPVLPAGIAAGSRGRLVPAGSESSCRSIIGTRKKAASFTRVIIIFGTARPAPTSIPALLDAFPLPRSDCFRFRRDR